LIVFECKFPSVACTACPGVFSRPRLFHHCICLFSFLLDPRQWPWLIFHRPLCSDLWAVFFFLLFIALTFYPFARLCRWFAFAPGSVSRRPPSDIPWVFRISPLPVRIFPESSLRFMHVMISGIDPLSKMFVRLSFSRARDLTIAVCRFFPPLFHTDHHQSFLTSPHRVLMNFLPFFVSFYIVSSCFPPSMFPATVNATVQLVVLIEETRSQTFVGLRPL